MTIRTLFIAVAVLVVPFALPAYVCASSPAVKEMVENAAHDGSRDFDFLHGGQWHVHNRQLAKRLVGSKDWVEFDATDEFAALPGNIGSEEHYRTDHWKDFVGVSFQLYNPKTHQWNEYWVDNHGAPGVLQPPVTGGFSGDAGLFEGSDTYDGKPITVRTRWKRVSADHVTWEQAFSPDGGMSWETNWTMDFTR